MALTAAAIAMIGASMIGTATSAITAARQRKQMKKMRDAGFDQVKAAREKEAALGASPTMEVPKSVDDYINLQRTMARQEMPGSTQMRQDINQTQAGMLSSSKQNAQGVDAMTAMLASGQNKMRALSQMGIAAAQYKTGQMNQYGQAVASRAPWEQQQFEYNQWIPWQQQKNEIMGEKNMGMQMGYTGMDGMMAAGANLGDSISRGVWSIANNPTVQNWAQGWGQGVPAQNTVGPNMPMNTGQTNPWGSHVYSPPTGTPDMLPSNLGASLGLTK